jgi:hypothetical protein
MKEDMLDDVCSCVCLGQSFVAEINTEMISIVRGVIINSVRLREERLECEKACCPQFTNELLGTGMNCHSDIHNALLYAVLNTQSHMKVLFTGVSAIYCRSVVFLGQEIPDFIAEFEHDVPQVM